MKKIIRVILIVMAILLLNACGKISKTPIQDSTQPQQSAPETVEQPTPEPTLEPTPQLQPIDYYREILNKWNTAVAEHWTVETLMEKDMNYLAAYCYSDDSLDRIGYLLHDMDGDGIIELIIGTITGDEYQDKIILELYTLSECEPVRVFTSGERNRYYFCTDGTIANEASNSAFLSSYSYYSFTEGILQEDGSILFDMAANKEQPYYFITGDSKVNIDENTANSKIAEYQEKYIIPAYTPFSQYQ